MQMMTSLKYTAGKLAALTLILFLLALGVLGILLPVLPGLLFLLIAALVAAHHFPVMAFLLKQNSYSRSALRISESFIILSLGDKVRLCFWGSIKVTMDGVTWALSMIKKIGQRLLG